MSSQNPLNAYGPSGSRGGSAGSSRGEMVRSTARTSVVRLAQPVGLLVFMWLIRAFDWVLPGTFNTYGIRSWDPTSVFGIVASPVLHSGWPHLISNTVPFLVLGLLVALDGVRRFWLVTVIVAVVSAVGTWVVNVPGTLTVGASGLVFGYFGYLLVRAFIARSLGHAILYAVIALVVGVAYGSSMVVGILPIHQGISWQAHFFGAVGGGLAVWLFRPRKEASAGS
ncbi:rhomboid family intramembrane serine protease [Brevibacterium litoralis]|uniref:rhomboid family intramembrane serine protease n=1 Tax=Brevibacterium litoralis TaxID=3138935 RepID=UPI0032EFED66